MPDEKKRTHADGLRSNELGQRIESQIDPLWVYPKIDEALRDKINKEFHRQPVSAEHIEEVVKQHIDVIITDHHEPTDKIPLCVATLNPKLVTSVYPARELTGVGVAFKLAHALTNHLVEEGLIPHKKIDLKRYLDL